MKFCSIAIALPVVALLACKKTDDMVMPQNMTPSVVNIDYPAAYVVNGETNSISIIKLSDNIVSENIMLSEMNSMAESSMNSGMSMMWPHHIYISPDKSKISVAFPGMDLSGGHDGGVTGMNGSFGVYDAETGSLVKSQALPVMNHNVAYSPDGKEIWTSQMMEMGTVLVFDASTYALKNTIQVGGMPAEVTFSYNGSVAFVANGMDSTITAIDATSKAVKATIAVGSDPVGAWPAQDGNMYVDNEKGKLITIINVASLSVTGTISLGFMPGYAAYIESMGNSELWVSDPDNGKIHWWMKDATMGWMHGGSFDTGAGAHAIAFTSDGTTAYVTNQLATTVSVIDVMNHKETKEIAVGKKPNGIIIKQ